MVLEYNTEPLKIYKYSIRPLLVILESNTEPAKIREYGTKPLPAVHKYNI